MIYGSLRVSTDRQDCESQRIGVINLAKRRGLNIDEWILDNGISGTKEPEKRNLGKILKIVKEGDILLASELSRLGRKLFMIMRILENCMNVGCKVITEKDGYELGNNITSKVLAFAFGLAAEIERDMISKRTIEGLVKARAAGKILGHPKGKKNNHKKLDNCQEVIKTLFDLKYSKSAIARKFKVNRNTLYAFMERNTINDRKLLNPPA
jgi:DNA invertase Pin-like site-specific DNA recombinase